jgi:hypothetical protein
VCVCFAVAEDHNPNILMGDTLHLLMNSDKIVPVSGHCSNTKLIRMMFSTRSLRSTAALSFHRLPGSFGRRGPDGDELVTVKFAQITWIF